MQWFVHEKSQHYYKFSAATAEKEKKKIRQITAR